MIRVETSKGNGVKNYQETEITDYDIKWARVLAMRHDKADPRTHSSAIYNCHGLVFASRRTKIAAPSEIRLILDDDKYDEISLNEVKPGDIVIYYNNKTGDLNHSGIIVAYNSSTDVTPMICSKWGRGPEYVHALFDVPEFYGPDFKYFRCKL